MPEKAVFMLDSDAIGPITWAKAYHSARSHPGMGSIKLEWNPYKCEWVCEINYADNTRNIGRNRDINKAIREATEANEGYWAAREGDESQEERD